MAYKRVRKLKLADAAYITGLLDGEGTITLTREHADENRRLVISISNTDLSILNLVRSTVGAGGTSKRTYSKRHTPSYAYKITNRQALTLLNHIAKFLKSYKRDRAQLALRQYTAVTPRNGRYTPEQSSMRREFDKRFSAIVP